MGSADQPHERTYVDIDTWFEGDAPWKALAKAVFAGIVVGVPWPLTGTIIGGWVLFFSGLGNVKKRILGT
jgi:hypothetical protein